MNKRVDVGSVLSQVFGIYSSQAGTLLPVAFVLFLIPAIVSGIGGVLVLVGLILSLIANALYTGMVVRLVEDVQDGRRDHSAGTLMASVTPMLFTLIVAGIVFGIPVGIGLVLIIVPGLLLWSLWAVFAPAIVLEGRGVFGSLGRSRELVQGSFGPVFGVIAVTFILTAVVSFVLGIVGAAIGSAVGSIIFSVIGSTITQPIAALTAGVLYFTLRGAPGPQDSWGGGPEADFNAPPPPPPPPAAPAV